MQQYQFQKQPMSKSKKAYKIKNLSTGEYISIGYRPKSTWSKFPGQAIASSIPESERNNYVVDVFELVQVDTVSLYNLKLNP